MILVKSVRYPGNCAKRGTSSSSTATPCPRWKRSRTASRPTSHSGARSLYAAQEDEESRKEVNGRSKCVYQKSTGGWFEAGDQLSRTTDHAPFRDAERPAHARPRSSPSQDCKSPLPLAQLKPIPTLRNVCIQDTVAVIWVVRDDSRDNHQEPQICGAPGSWRGRWATMQIRNKNGSHQGVIQ